MKVSVIVPVYNKEKYLDRCIESICKQTYADLEIIIINDGSSDSSDEICRRWDALDNRIRYISQSNAGVSVTRNRAVDMSTGDVISFIDADDYIVSNAIEIIEGEIAGGADACYFGRYLLAGDKFLDHYLRLEKREEYCGPDIRTDFVRNFIGGLPGQNVRNYVSGSACTAAYRAEVLKSNNVRFGDITQNEDSIFNLKVNQYTERVVVIPDILYVNNINVGSSSRRYVGDRFEQYKEWYYTCISYSESYKQCSDFVLRTQYRLWQSVNLCLRLESLHKKENGKKHEYAVIKKICTDEEVARIARVMCKMEQGKVKRVFAELVKLGSPFLIDMYFGTWQVVNKIKSNKKYNTEMKNPISA